MEHSTQYTLASLSVSSLSRRVLNRLTSCLWLGCRKLLAVLHRVQNAKAKARSNADYSRADSNRANVSCDEAP